MVAMNIEITADAESTTRAAAVRDAGAKVSQPRCCLALSHFFSDASAVVRTTALVGDVVSRGLFFRGCVGLELGWGRVWLSYLLMFSIRIRT